MSRRFVDLSIHLENDMAVQCRPRKSAVCLRSADVNCAAVRSRAPLSLADPKGSPEDGHSGHWHCASAAEQFRRMRRSGSKRLATPQKFAKICGCRRKNAGGQVPYPQAGCG